MFKHNKSHSHIEKKEYQHLKENFQNGFYSSMNLNFALAVDIKSGVYEMHISRLVQGAEKLIGCIPLVGHILKQATSLAEQEGLYIKWHLKAKKVCMFFADFYQVHEFSQYVLHQLQSNQYKQLIDVAQHHGVLQSILDDVYKELKMKNDQDLHQEGAYHLGYHLASKVMYDYVAKSQSTKQVLKRNSQRKTFLFKSCQQIIHHWHQKYSKQMK